MEDGTATDTRLVAGESDQSVSATVERTASIDCSNMRRWSIIGRGDRENVRVQNGFTRAILPLQLISLSQLLNAHASLRYTSSQPFLLRRSSMAVKTQRESISSCCRRQKRSKAEMILSFLGYLDEDSLSRTRRCSLLSSTHNQRGFRTRTGINLDESIVEGKSSAGVRFFDVEVREYEVIASDNPSVLSGVALEVREMHLREQETTAFCHSVSHSCAS